VSERTLETGTDTNVSFLRRVGRTRVVIAVVIGLLVAAGVVGYRVVSSVEALGPNESSSSSSLPAKVGQRIWFGYAGLLPHGTDPVHITGFRLVGVPDGVRVLSLASARFTAHGYPLAVTDGDLARYFPDLKPEPVSAMTLVPGQPEDWFLLASLSASRPGTFVVPAIEVDYQVGWRHGSTVFHYAAELDVTKTS